MRDSFPWIPLYLPCEKGLPSGPQYSTSESPDNGNRSSHRSSHHPLHIIRHLNIPGVCFAVQQLLVELNVPFADDAHARHLGLRAA